MLFYFLHGCFQSGLNGTAITPNQSTAPPPKPAVPPPPPRDHLKVEKDGRIVNRMPVPQLPARINNNNNSISSPVVLTTPVAADPTREQLDSIRKYQVSKPQDS